MRMNYFTLATLATLASSTPAAPTAPRDIAAAADLDSRDNGSWLDKCKSDDDCEGDLVCKKFYPWTGPIYLHCRAYNSILDD